MLEFDSRGNIFPYERNKITLTEFEEIFVENFRGSTNRRKLFDAYLRYLNDFQNQISSNFVHWIDGSFVTKKENPNDLDLVSILNFDIVCTKRELLREKFLFKAAQNEYNIDAFLIEQHSISSINRHITEIDSLYWVNWFTKTKPNRAKQKFLKGFIEIEFL
jgi:hypothetical protein